MKMTRREMISLSGAAALGLGLAGCCAPGSAQTRTKKVLFFTKSAGFEHSVIKRNQGQPSFAEKLLAEWGPKHAIDFSFSKDGSLFTPEYLAGFDAFMFYTTGDLTTAGSDKNPPMTPAGKQAFLDAIKHGKGFLAMHSGSDTFHSPGSSDHKAGYHNDGDNADPYIKMLGGEFITHGSQQKCWMRVGDSGFPGMAALGGGFEITDEWYSLRNLASDLHVLLVQETKGMSGKMYQRPPYPATWARMHGKGRVFYTSMGHREDVWTNPIFQEVLFGGIDWAVRRVNADVTPNVDKVAAGYATLPPV